MDEMEKSALETRIKCLESENFDLRKREEEYDCMREKLMDYQNRLNEATQTIRVYEAQLDMVKMMCGCSTKKGW